MCHCRKQSFDGSPVWHNHSPQYHGERTRRWWVSHWRAQGPRGCLGLSLSLSNLIGKWRNGRGWMTVPWPRWRWLLYSPVSSLASCSQKDLKGQGQPEHFISCDHHIKEKEKNIFIKFSASWSATVVPTQLISTIHSSHELVVGYDALWARYFRLLPSSLNSTMAQGLTVDITHHLMVHPGTCWHLSSLTVTDSPP